MIPQEAIAKYRSIRAPASLQETVMKKMAVDTPVIPMKKRIPTWKPLLAAAACVAVIFIAGLPGRNGTRLSVDGTSIGAAPVEVSQSAFAPRTFALAAAEPLILDLSVNQEISMPQTAVSHGEIVLDDPVNGATTLQWIITDPQQTREATLTLNIKNHEAQYLLHADANGVWYLEKTK